MITEAIQSLKGGTTTTAGTHGQEPDDTEAGVSNVIPLAYSLKSVARRAGCSQQEVLKRLAEDGLPTYIRGAQLRIPRGVVTGYDSRYDTRLAWVPTRRYA